MPHINTRLHDWADKRITSNRKHISHQLFLAKPKDLFRDIVLMSVVFRIPLKEFDVPIEFLKSLNYKGCELSGEVFNQRARELMEQL